MANNIAANLALALGVLVHIISYLIPSVYITDDVYVEMSGALKATLAVVPNIALWWGIKVISIEEGRGAGIQWDTLGDRAQPSDPMTMSLVFVMLIADVLIYAIIVWYIDGIWPGKYGVRRKWYFPFQVKKKILLYEILIAFLIWVHFLFFLIFAVVLLDSAM